jgi:hypothetical protein
MSVLESFWWLIWVILVVYPVRIIIFSIIVSAMAIGHGRGGWMWVAYGCVYRILDIGNSLLIMTRPEKSIVQDNKVFLNKLYNNIYGEKRIES